MSIVPKILLATDGSENSELAAQTAVDLSKRLDSELHVVYVAPEHPYRHAYYDLRHQEEVEQFRRDDQQRTEDGYDRAPKGSEPFGGRRAPGRSIETLLK